MILNTKNIVKGIRLHLDEEMKKRSFKFNSRWQSYINFDAENDLYFEVSLSFLNYVAKGTNYKSKYLEIYLNIYHTETSKMLLAVATRGKNLDSFFNFPIVGNMLPDIILNPDRCIYMNRNNHNYFKLEFVTEEDIKVKSEEILSLVIKYAIPFFESLDSLEKIKTALDCCYSKDLSINNATIERHLSLAALLYHFNDTLKENKIQKIRDYFISIRHDEAILELNTLVQKFEDN